MNQWLPLVMIFVYLAIVLYIGIFAFRKGKSTGEDFFLASRSIGSIVFFLSLFATNMTAVAILGSSGFAYKRGIGVFGMMATASCFVIPISLFVIGTRIWALGKRFGHMTQVAYFRDRWECSSIGTFIFILTSAMMMPYLIVSIVGGGTILESLTGGLLNYYVAGAIVALVVMGNVFFGGMRGAVLVNVFQTILFLCFGAIAFAAINKGMPAVVPGGAQGFEGTIKALLSDAKRIWPLERNNAGSRSPISPREFFSYCFIPLSSIMFPHMSIMCLTAKKVSSFKRTVVLYPLCIMAIWLPCVYLGSIANGQPRVNAAIAAESPGIEKFLESHGEFDQEKVVNAKALVTALKAANTPEINALLEKVKTAQPKMDKNEFGKHLFDAVHAIPKEQDKLRGPIIAQVGILAKSASTDSVLLQMLRLYVDPWLAGLLAAGIISAVMGSDCHQILALSTMFTQDVYNYYGGANDGKKTVFFGRAFIVIANTIAFIVACFKPNIFELAISWAFTGFAALAPVMLAALFWKRSTKYGALLATVWVTLAVTGVGVIEKLCRLPEGSPPAERVISNLFSAEQYKFLALSPGGGKLFIFGFMPVMFIVLGSAACMVIGSLLSKPPSEATIQKYFAK